MQILITGWTGYIAPVMARVLRLAGHQLTGLDTGFFEPCSMGSVADPALLIRKDVRDVTPADLSGFDAVIHLAALSNDPMGDCGQNGPTKLISRLAALSREWHARPALARFCSHPPAVFMAPQPASQRRKPLLCSLFPLTRLPRSRPKKDWQNWHPNIYHRFS